MYQGTWIFSREYGIYNVKFIVKLTIKAVYTTISLNKLSKTKTSVNCGLTYVLGFILAHHYFGKIEVVLTRLVGNWLNIFNENKLNTMVERVAPGGQEIGLIASTSAMEKQHLLVTFPGVEYLNATVPELIEPSGLS